MIRFVLTLFLLSLAGFAFGHNGYIKGTVKDNSNREPLAGANIYVREISSGTTSDLFGRFQLTLKPGIYTLEISFVGFRTEIITREVVEHQTAMLDVQLTAGALQLSDVVVNGSGVAAKTSRLSDIDIALRPVNSSQEVLRMVPGLFIAQHAGGGKAEQIFLRGFDIDHGTDISLTVDGMPVNMVSHAHGQGYSDLHFLIPETVRSIDLGKGPHETSKGNFATAGFVAFNTYSAIDQSSVKVEGGSYGLFRNVNLLKLMDHQQGDSRHHLYAATEFFRSDGYFESPQDFHRLNGMIKFFSRSGDRRIFHAAVSGFSSSWRASGQIPVRAVESGRITRFGAIDDGEGGTTSRYNVNASLTNRLDNSFLEQRIFASRYDFDLLSNFTFFLNDPVHGDRILQRETRHLFGYDINYTREYELHRLNMETRLGGGLRHDIVDDVELTHVIDRANPVDYAALGDVRESNAFAFADHSLSFPWRLTIKAGLRYDQFNFRYADQLREQDQQVSKGILSPKLSLEYDATRLTKVFVKAAYGFHSNDSRAIVEGSSIRILPRALGVDAGIQWKPFPDLFVESAFWYLALEDELVYVGDEGIVEPSGATRRKGVELSLRYQASRTLYADADVTYTIARSAENSDGAGNYIPLAPSMTGMGGLVYRNGGIDVSFRGRYLADRPANEDNSLIAEGYLLADASMGYTLNRLTFRISAENIFNTAWREAQFETTSKLRDELDEVTEIHFTPGTPRALKASVQLKF